MTKRITFFVLMLIAASPAFAQIDQTMPEATLDGVFSAARSGNFEGLAKLCDPNGQNDGDTECLCAFDPEYVRNRCKEQFPLKEFKSAFQDARITDPANYFIQNGQEYAEVKFLFGPGGKRSETMKMVKRGDNWYLLSF